MSTIGNIAVVGTVAKFSVSFPLVYHYMASVRHFVWDRLPEKTLYNEQVEQSSYALIGGSVALSALLAFVSL